MKELKFKCVLLSDVVLNMKSASEGTNQTLEFIPGNCFLGIAARHYDDFGNDAFEVFHSGKVRFGDAHPAADQKRSVKVPAVMYYPKLKSPSQQCFISYAHKPGSGEQMKQCRNGFYVFSDSTGTLVNQPKTFALKSAYDRNARRSANGMIFGYESLAKGLEFYFTVEVDNDSLADKIAGCLTGIRHIGRSRTAQYGLIRIEQEDFRDNYTSSSVNDGFITVYADGRLIFLDNNGNPTYRISARQLGISGGSIDWSRTRIRTFRYSPWNSKRQCFDSERICVEKGSVFVVTGGEMPDKGSGYVGSYCNEGFGKVLYSPSFLDTKGSDGEAAYRLDGKRKTEPKAIPITRGDIPLLRHLRYRKDIIETDTSVYKIVNSYVKDNSNRYQSESFASQWGAIRSIVAKCKSLQEIKDKLFDKKTGYLYHGIAKEKWDQLGRSESLRTFVNEFTDDRTALKAMVNLCAEMAKKQREGGYNGDI